MFTFSLLSLAVLYLYTETNLIQTSYDYYTSELLGYIFWWSTTLLILGSISVFIKDYFYKKWLIVSSIIALLSIIFAYKNRRGSGGILSFDGELITFTIIGLYSFISIIYFIVQFVKNKRNK